MNRTVCFSYCLTITCCYCSYACLHLFKHGKLHQKQKIFFLTLHPPYDIRKSHFRQGGCSVNFLNNEMDIGLLPTPLLSQMLLLLLMPDCTYLVIFKTRKITSTANDLFLTLHPPPSIRKGYFRLGGCSVKFLSNKMDSAFLPTSLCLTAPLLLFFKTHQQ